MPDEDQLPALGERKLVEEQRVDHAENRGRRADAEAQRENGDDREGRGPPEPAPRVSDVRQRGFDAVADPRVADLFLDVLHPAKLAEGSEPRDLGRQAAPHMPIGQLLDECAELFVQLVIQTMPAQQRIAQAPDAGEERHAVSPPRAPGRRPGRFAPSFGVRPRADACRLA